MWNFPIRKKIILMISFLIAIISGFIYIYFPSRLESQATTHLVDKARSIVQMTAFSISPSLLFGDAAEATAVMEGARQTPELIYMVAFGAEGKEFLSSPADRQSATEEDVYRTVTPIMHLEREIGHLEAAFSMEKLRQEAADSRATAALVSLLAFLAGGTWVFVISTVVTRPSGT
jgi:sensor histidine kinase regulating citrate/malate metabolism